MSFRIAQTANKPLFQNLGWGCGLPSMYGALRTIPSVNRVHACNPNTGEMEVGGSGMCHGMIQGTAWATWNPV